jgi:hypothetical protein
MNSKKLSQAIALYGTRSTKKMFEEMLQLA